MDKTISFEAFYQLNEKTLEWEQRSNIRAKDHNGSTGAFPYIPQTSARQLYLLFSSVKEVIKRNTWSPLGSDGKEFQVNMLDIGCGTARIVYLAKQFGINAKGVEFHKPYVDWGRKKYKLSDEEVVCMNAFDMTPEFLSKINFVYTYMPMSDGRKMLELHTNFYNKLPGQCLIVEMYPVYYPMNIIDRSWRDKNFPGEAQPSFSVVWKNYPSYR